MRNLCAVVLAAALVTTSAFAASSTKGQLAPGTSAGVRNAQSSSTVAAIVGGTALVGMMAALISGSGAGAGGGASNPNGQLNTAVTSTST